VEAGSHLTGKNFFYISWGGAWAVAENHVFRRRRLFC
jgi:hypothetical protein